MDDPLIGAVIRGNFRVLKRIGAGGMGVIYTAEQLSLGRTVVVKMLHKDAATDGRRLQREAQAAAMLKHPNTVDVIEFGETESGALYIAMEYINGSELGELLRDQYPLGPARLVRIVKQICLALDQAHEKHIIHRDLKPENIMLERRKNEPDVVKVVDFGIAKIMDPERRGDRWATMGISGPGTVEYMSPEQIRGETLDGRSDLYALGVILYQLLTNSLPHTGNSAATIAAAHLTQRPRPPRELVPDVHPGLEWTTLRLLAKDRDARPESALEVYEMLDVVEADLLERGDMASVPAASPPAREPTPPRPGMGIATAAAHAWAAELRRTMTNAYSAASLEAGVRQAARAGAEARDDDGRQMRLNAARKALDALLRSLQDRLNRTVSRENRVASLPAWDRRAVGFMASPAFQAYRVWLSSGQGPSIGSIAGWVRERVDAGVPVLSGTTGAALGLAQVSLALLEAAAKTRNVLAHVTDYEQPGGPDLGRAALWLTLGPDDDPRLDIAPASLRALIRLCEDVCGRIAGTTIG